jgi:hypothetical protein
VSLTDNQGAVDAAIKAFREGAMFYTMMDLNQKPGEGNYDRIEQLRLEDAIRAAEAWEPPPVDEDDTLVMQEVHTSEDEEN